MLHFTYITDYYELSFSKDRVIFYLVLKRFFFIFVAKYEKIKFIANKILMRFLHPLITAY